MKFTKQDAIKELEAKIPTKDKELDLSRTISEAVDNSIELIGEDSEMELSDFVEKVFKQVKTSIGLTHSENSKVATRLQEQITELQKKIDEKGGKQTTDSEDPTVKALQDKLDEIERTMQLQKSEKAIAEKRTALAAKMGESIKDKDWIESYLAEINVTEETDVEAKAKDYVAFYNKTHTRSGKITPKKAGDEEDDDAYVKSTVAEAAKLAKQRHESMSGSPVMTQKES